MMIGFGFVGILFMVVFWVALIALAVWLVKSIFPNQVQTPSSPSGSNSNALEIIDERYARGEITREQYELMKKDINK
jgi:putative membrane protein